jgi:hypothetical protein
MKRFVWLLVVLSFAPLARATLLVEESFNYAAGTQLHGQNGGVGWTNAWVNSWPHATLARLSYPVTPKWLF